jgi:hypothetical protein
MGHKAHRADDKRGPGLGDNVKTTVSEGDGAGKRLVIFNDRSKGRNGRAKRSVK